MWFVLGFGCKLYIIFNFKYMYKGLPLTHGKIKTLSKKPQKSLLIEIVYIFKYVNQPININQVYLFLFISNV